PEPMWPADPSMVAASCPAEATNAKEPCRPVPLVARRDNRPPARPGELRSAAADKLGGDSAAPFRGCAALVLPGLRAARNLGAPLRKIERPSLRNIGAGRRLLSRRGAGPLFHYGRQRRPRCQPVRADRSRRRAGGLCQSSVFAKLARRRLHGLGWLRHLLRAP